MEIEPGTIVANRYRVLRPLGRGGMGEVLAAENTRTGRTVAIKVLHADAKAKHSAVERFKREARAAGSINSDYVTQVLDVEEDATFGIVLVFELLEGESLIDRLKRTGPIPFEELWGIIEKVWMGLADAHRVGIIHRDLKPSNIFLEHRQDGTTRVKILDFGISKLPKEMEGETLTEMGQSLGTFSFMPPEQIGKAKLVDHRADIYASTTMIYQSLTGQLPYVAKNVLVMVELKAKEPPRRVADALEGPVDPRLEAFVAKGLARDANQRFQTAVEALAAWRELSPNGQTSAHGQGAPSAPWSSGPVTPSRAQPSSSPSGYRGAAVEGHASRRETPMPGQTPLELDATSDDAAATLAMPISRLMALPGLGAKPSASASWAPPPVTDPRMGGTVMMQQQPLPPMPAGPSRPPAYGAQPTAMSAQPPPQRPLSLPPQPNAWPQQTGPHQAAAPAPSPWRLYTLIIIACALVGAGIVTLVLVLSAKQP